MATNDDKTTVKKTAANRMVTKDQDVDPQGVFGYAADVRALVDEIRERLDSEVRQPLADAAEAAVSGGLVGANQRIQSHLDDVHRALDALVAGAAHLAQQSTAV